MTRFTASTPTLRRGLTPLVVAVVALASTSAMAPAIAAGGAQQPDARLAVFLPSSSVAQTTSGWSLATTRVVDKTAGTVTWQINASPSGAATKTLALASAALGGTATSVSFAADGSVLNDVIRNCRREKK